MELTIGAGLLVTATVLGVTHGIEPDHVAGVTALTHEADNPRLSALVGACFAAGHVALVVVWIAIAHLLLGTTAFPAVFETFGMVLVGIILSILSLYLGISGTRRILHKHGHIHDRQPHSHYHIHIPAFLRLHTNAHNHAHTALEYLKIGTIGALFTLSPPVSMIAFISVTAPETELVLLVGIVIAYTIAIIVTMAGIGGAAGSVFRFSRARSERVHAVSQIVASVLVLAFAAIIFSNAIPQLPI